MKKTQWIHRNDHDISQMNTQDCMNLIPLIRDKAKEGHQERTL